MNFNLLTGISKTRLIGNIFQWSITLWKQLKINNGSDPILCDKNWQFPYCNMLQQVAIPVDLTDSGF